MKETFFTIFFKNQNDSSILSQYSACEKIVESNMAIKEAFLIDLILYFKLVATLINPSENLGGALRALNIN